jgi:hypothetical protein
MLRCANLTSLLTSNSSVKAIETGAIVVWEEHG